MGYCTLEEVRAEGLPESVADDDRVLRLIEDKSREIDRATGWWFEPRTFTMILNGTDERWLHLAAPAVEITEVRWVWQYTDPDTSDVIDPDYYVLQSYDLPDHRYNPKLTLIEASGSVLAVAAGVDLSKWIAGEQNYHIDGTFGFLEDDGAGGLQTPTEIRDACIDLVLHRAPSRWSQLSGQDMGYSLRSGDLRSHTVQGRSATWGGASSVGSTTGVSDVDRTLAKYRNQIGVAAA